MSPSAGAASAEGPAPAAPRRRNVALCGNPNTGKTSLFNRLTGGNAKVGNYAGVTVEREVGRWKVRGGEIELHDVPGAYSLAARSPEEQCAVRALFPEAAGEAPAAVVVVVDATQLLRNLYLVAQLLEAGTPLVVALNLIDAARAQRVEPDARKLEAALGVPVVAVSAKTGEGISDLEAALERVLAEPAAGRKLPQLPYPPALLADVARIERKLAGRPAAEARAMALWALLSVDDHDELEGVPAELRAEVAAVRGAALAAGRDPDAEVVGARYAWLDALDVRPPEAKPGSTATDKLDAVLLHPLAGGAIFLAVMAVIFQALFSWSDPAITAIESAFAWLGDAVRGVVPAGLLADFLVDGVVAGVGSVLVFLPQILLLFLFVSFLEDSGYMARVAFLVDRVMRSVGLNGRAFVPMLSGYACAVPAVMATRTLERRRDRLLTMMVIPLMSCSARLPVYTLVIAALIPPSARLFGVLPAQGATLVGMYLFATATALLAAGVLGRTVLRGQNVPLLLELPPYRLPRASVVARLVARRAWSFVSEAGTVILVCSVILWALLSFPRDVALSKDYDALRAGADEAAVAVLDAEEAGERLRLSYGGRLGRALEPAIEPLGFDWKIGIGLVGAFAAREVFVSTLGIVYGIGGDDEEGTLLRERIRAERGPDGAPRYGLASGLSLMVFFALSAQCMSTLAAVRRETRSWRWPAFLFGYMTALAWIASLLVYQGGKLLGLG